MIFGTVPIAIATMGRTASGKTTVAKFLAQQLNATMVPEAAMKRALRTSYLTEDSLDEDLRDLGYRAAIAVFKECLAQKKPAIIDASFHSLRRRDWLYDSIRGLRPQFIMIYCQCANEEKTQMRILHRAQMPVTSETQANSIGIFRHIDRTFDEPSPSEFSNVACAGLFVLDTDMNMIRSIDVYGFTGQASRDYIIKTQSILESYLLEARGWETNESRCV